MAVSRQYTVPPAVVVAVEAWAQISAFAQVSLPAREDAAPPVAVKRPHEITAHGHTRRDNYYWLRERESPEVLAHLQAEMDYTARIMKPSEGLQQKLIAEMMSRMGEEDSSPPVFERGYFYYSRTEKGAEYEIFCRRKGSMQAPEEIMLDVNELARGKQYYDLGERAVSDNGRYLAYAADDAGEGVYVLRIKDLATGKHLPDVIESADTPVWSANGRYVYYVTYDDANRPFCIYRHRVGEATDEEDRAVHHEKDAQYDAKVERTRDGRFILFSSESFTTTEVHYLRSDDPLGRPRRIAPRVEGVQYHVDHRDREFYVRTNAGAPGFEIVATSDSAPNLRSARVVVPRAEGVNIEEMWCFAGNVVTSERAGGQERIRVMDPAGKNARSVEFPEQSYSITVDVNPQYNTDCFRFTYSSFVSPESVYDYNMRTHERRLLKNNPAPGFNPALYSTEYVFAAAGDGTKIPISLVYRKGTVNDGTAPLLLYGYGAYGDSMEAEFDSGIISLLDRGVVYAIAHVRGGGEFGEAWHSAGQGTNKITTFTDFISCAEYLVDQKYTTPKKLAIEGGSAGGLLTAAVTNMRPDLFCAAIIDVPFVDVPTTMLDTSLPLVTGEFVEWGNPANREDYFYMLQYSPYDNVAAKDYPALLVETALNDTSVMYWEPAKYVARLRELKTDSNPLIFYVDMNAGHAGRTGRFDLLREVAFDYAFLLGQWGIKE